jgi:hypothetical protein
MWMSDPMTPMRSMRVSDAGELVLAGESFDQGSAETNEKYAVLEKWMREHFPVDRIVHRWSGQRQRKTNASSKQQWNGGNRNGATDFHPADVYVCVCVAFRLQRWISPARLIFPTSVCCTVATIRSTRPRA